MWNGMINPITNVFITTIPNEFSSISYEKRTSVSRTTAIFSRILSNWRILRPIFLKVLKESRIQYMLISIESKTDVREHMGFNFISDDGFHLFKDPVRVYLC